MTDNGPPIECAVAKAIELELAIMDGPSEFAHLYDGSSPVGLRLARVAISAYERARRPAPPAVRDPSEGDG